MLPRSTSPKILSTTPRLPSTTPPSHRSTTRMLPQPNTPRLHLITPPKWLTTTPSCPSTTPPGLQIITPQLMLPRATTPKSQSITLPRATQLQLRLPSITKVQLTTQRLLLRTTLYRNITPRLQFTASQPTLHLAATPKSPSTTPKRPNITHPHTLLQFTTPRNPSITLLQTTTKQRLLFARPRFSSITLQSMLPPATTPRPSSTTIPRHLSIIPLLTLLRPTTSKLRSITLPPTYYRDAPKY
jgi:hypothetical protein